jgi:ribosomal protein S12 methylthiotransferase accessory factor YcaO
MKTNGPGKYDPEVLELMERLQAKGICVIVFDGERGHGVAAKGTHDFMHFLPGFLESLAAQVRNDLSS